MSYKFQRFRVPNDQDSEATSGAFMPDLSAVCAFYIDGHGEYFQILESSLLLRDDIKIPFAAGVSYRATEDYGTDIVLPQGDSGVVVKRINLDLAAEFGTIVAPYTYAACYSPSGYLLALGGAGAFTATTSGSDGQTQELHLRENTGSLIVYNLIPQLPQVALGGNSIYLREQRSERTFPFKVLSAEEFVKQEPKDGPKVDPFLFDPVKSLAFDSSSKYLFFSTISGMNMVICVWDKTLLPISQLDKQFKFMHRFPASKIITHPRTLIAGFLSDANRVPFVNLLQEEVAVLTTELDGIIAGAFAYGGNMLHLASRDTIATYIVQENELYPGSAWMPTIRVNEWTIDDGEILDVAQYGDDVWVLST